MTESQNNIIEASTSQKMTTTWHQQVFALDAKYNTLRANKLPNPSLGIYNVLFLSYHYIIKLISFNMRFYYRYVIHSSKESAAP